MYNNFDWERTKEVYKKWWNHELNRPLVFSVYGNGEPYCGNIPYISQSNCHDFSISATDIIDRIDYDYKNTQWIGDGYPHINFDFFGPGVVAAFCGATLDNSSGLVWFSYNGSKDINDLHIKFDRNNKWLNRIKDIYHAGNKKWNGKVLMGMPDIGGTLDILASFRTTEELLMDLYDEPNEVKRLCKEIQTAWIETFNFLNEVLQPVNPGYSDWSSLYSEQPSYILQSDFAFMISPDMFNNFAFDDLSELVDYVPNTIYHLDGTGQLDHLDKILTLDKLNAVQWVPGDGEKPPREWLEVYKKIAAAKKNFHIVGDDYNDFKAIVDTVGCNGAYCYANVWAAKNLTEAENILKEKYYWSL